MISRIVVFVVAHILMVGVISGASVYSSKAQLNDHGSALAAHSE
jgi:hypothetical protein